VCKFSWFYSSSVVIAFSRGAILGLIVTLAVAIIIPGIGFIRNNLRRVASIVVLVCVVVTGIFILSINLHPRTFKNVVLHADEQTTLRDPNELRIDFVKRSLNRIYHNPQGTGLGTAGLASMKNEQSGVYLTENYYLQLAIEIGLVGLIVFTTLIVVVVAKLYFVWRGYGKYYSLAMLSSFTGLFVTNMLAHIWTNETIAVIWWGTAGVVLWQPIHTGVKMYKKTQNNVV
jgi:hypothetical protein